MNLKDTLSGLKSLPDQIVSDSKAIGAKRVAIKQYTESASEAPAASAPKAAKPSKSDLVNPGAKYGTTGPGEKRLDTTDATKPLGSFKKGGKVHKTGVYMLHEKERVLNAKQSAKVAKKGGIAKLLS